MRVVHINEHATAVGGVEVYLHDLASRLNAEGVEQQYWYAVGESAAVGCSALQLPEISRIGRRAEREGLSAVQRLLRAFRPDVIHLHRVYNPGVMRACVEYGPTVVTCHDYLYLCPAASFFRRRTRTICGRQASAACFLITLWHHCLTPRPRYALAYYRRVRQFFGWKERFAAVLCPSDSVRERLLDHGFPAQRTYTLPYFCPLEPRDEPRPLPRQPAILFMGRLRSIKGYDVFLQALAMLPDVTGILVGDIHGAAAETACRLKEEWGCDGRLECRPWARRDELPDLFARASVFLFPSIWPETLGIVGLEALSCGVPVVASDVGGVRQWLRHGENGLLVPPKDPSALAEAVRNLLASPERLLTMGRAGIASIREKFLPSQHIERLLAIYRGAMAWHAFNRREAEHPCPAPANASSATCTQVTEQSQQCDTRGNLLSP